MLREENKAKIMRYREKSYPTNVYQIGYKIFSLTKHISLVIYFFYYFYKFFFFILQQLVLVLCACVAGSLAGFIQPFATGAIKGATAADLGKYGSDSLKASDLLRDAGRVNAAADLWTNAGQQVWDLMDKRNTLSTSR